MERRWQGYRSTMSLLDTLLEFDAALDWCDESDDPLLSLPTSLVPGLDSSASAVGDDTGT